MYIVKYIILFIWVIFPLCSIAKGQRKIDTTPITDIDKWVLQTELNYYHIPNQISQNTGNILPTDTYYINATISRQIRTGTVIQVGTYNCPLAGGGAQNYECDTYINLSQNIPIYREWSALIGSQNGTVFKGPLAWHNADYGLLEYNLSSTINIHAGTYFVDKDLSLTTNKIGYTTGISMEYMDWKFEGDYFNGSTNISGANVNIFWKQYYIGVLVPEHNSGNNFSGVTGFKIAFN